MISLIEKITVNNFVFYERSVVEDKKLKSTKIRKYTEVFYNGNKFFLNIFSLSDVRIIMKPCQHQEV